jgi:hypothetical protein
LQKPQKDSAGRPGKRRTGKAVSERSRIFVPTISTGGWTLWRSLLASFRVCPWRGVAGFLDAMVRNAGAQPPISREVHTWTIQIFEKSEKRSSG